jgi:hypothetical protein
VRVRVSVKRSSLLPRPTAVQGHGRHVDAAASSRSWVSVSFTEYSIRFATAAAALLEPGHRAPRARRWR